MRQLGFGREKREGVVGFRGEKKLGVRDKRGFTAGFLRALEEEGV